MSAQLEIPNINIDAIPHHLRDIALAAHELVERSFTAPQDFYIPPFKVENSNFMLRAYWEAASANADTYEKIALHLGTNALMISHEHKHPRSSQLPYVGKPLPKEFVRETIVLEQGKATLFPTGPFGVAEYEDITQNPEQGKAFTNRVGHALSTLGIKLYSQSLLKVS